MTTQPINLASQSGNAVPERVHSTGMYLALAGILMFFTGLASAWVVRKGLSTSSLEGPLELPFGLLCVNTFLLVAGSATLEIARRGLIAGNRQSFRRWVYAASMLGVGFLAGQIFVWRALRSAGLLVASNPDASFFFLITAAHGVLLIVAILAVLIVAARDVRQTTSEAARVIGIYWHFLTLLWCAIFLLLMANTKL